MYTIQNGKEGQYSLNITLSYHRGEPKIKPDYKMVNNWEFHDASKDEDYNAKLANLAGAMAIVAHANGLTVNDMHQLFPAVLRMLKTDHVWSK